MEDIKQQKNIDHIKYIVKNKAFYINFINGKIKLPVLDK